MNHDLAPLFLPPSFARIPKGRSVLLRRTTSLSLSMPSIQARHSMVVALTIILTGNLLLES